jgi:PIN domain nuclease of toxin-antitoxin system
MVFDASAVLALLAGEPGAEVVRASLPNAVISTVNLSEVGAKLADRGVKEPAIRNAISLLGLEVVAFDEAAAYAAAAMRPATRHLGLSLGDRACLALAASRGVPALTTDRNWASLAIGVEVRLARGGS